MKLEESTNVPRSTLQGQIDVLQPIVTSNNRIPEEQIENRKSAITKNDMTIKEFEDYLQTDNQ